VSQCIPSPRCVNIDASMATHRPGKRYRPGIPVRSRAFESSANSTCRHPTLEGACLQVSGKRGRVTGKLRKESSPDNDDHFRLTYNLPPRSLTLLVEIWRSHNSLSLRRRNPSRWAIVLGKGHRGGGSCFLNLLHWERQYHIIFLHFALVQ
jgi:hypothetical protein